jgi:hypothetical protein
VVHSIITCSPPDPITRTQRLDVRLTVKQADTTSYLTSTDTLRTYDRSEVQHLIPSIASHFTLLALHDYSHVSQRRFDSPLHWPHDDDWSSWDGIEALVLIFQKINPST